MKYISMFTGIGGVELGIKKATKGKWQCIGYSEINKYAIQVFERHFPGIKNYGDATKIKTEELPDFDLLCGGFPCQAFSIAGKRKGFNDTRGTLFYEICRIAKDKRPYYLFLENVKGLLSHDRGRTFAIILSSLDELGYDVEWQVLNSKHFGVPQNRERVFIIGHLRGQSSRKVFPLEESSQGNLKYSAGVISAREKWIKGKKNLSREFSQGQRIYDASGISQTLAGNAGGQGGKTGLYQIAQALQTDGMLRQGTSWGTDKPQSSRNIRRLTPTECERLQGFPDGWTEGLSDTQRYKCLGNAVTVNVIEAIVKNMLK